MNDKELEAAIKEIIDSAKDTMREPIKDTLLVSIDFSHGTDTGVLVIGRKRPNQSVEVVNAFQGKEAMELYKKLVTRAGRENDNV